MNANNREGVRQALLSHIAHEAYTPQTVQQLATTLGVCDVPAYKTMVRALISLEEEGAILRNKHDEYRLATPPLLH
jgi:ribonuclease R